MALLALNGLQDFGWGSDRGQRCQELPRASPMFSYALSLNTCPPSALLLAFSCQRLAWLWALFNGQVQLMYWQGGTGLEERWCSPCAALAPPSPGACAFSCAVANVEAAESLPAALLPWLAIYSFNIFSIFIPAPCCGALCF